ncbi:TPA: hypothetical protein I7114_08225 [Vibrio vulnificus]|nr:hypothetical protein [Vibrio vulnificus]HDY8011779.1 hypothetical protein [Vibrio vulnificus]
MKTLILCVDYKTTQDTISFVNRVCSLSHSVDIVLVCNSGSNDFIGLSEKENVYVYDFHENLGYMEGANRGLKEYLNDHDMPSWVILSNTDIDFRDKSFFEKLNEDKNTDCIIAPEIITLDNVYQNPFLEKRPSKSKVTFLKKIYSNVLTFYIYDFLSNVKSSIYKKGKCMVDNKIYAPHGAFVIIGKKYFESGADLSHPAFLYGEEIIIAERARNVFVDVVYDKKYKILHKEHVSTGKLGSKLKSKCLHDSLSYVLNNFYG